MIFSRIKDINSDLRIFFYLLAGILFSNIPAIAQAQSAGDAIQFDGNSYFSLILPLDSLEDCTIELWVNPSQNLIRLIYFMLAKIKVRDSDYMLQP